MKLHILTCTDENARIVSAEAFPSSEAARAALGASFRKEKKDILASGWEEDQIAETFGEGFAKLEWGSTSEYTWEITEADMPEHRDAPGGKPDYRGLLERYESTCRDLRAAVIPGIKDFILANGRRDGDVTRICIDVEIGFIYDPITILVETDRHTGDMGNEELERISVEKDGRLSYDTASYSGMQDELSLDNLIAIRDLFAAVADDEYLKVSDGTILFREDSELEEDADPETDD